ncbi:DUF2141 domain-containing protein [Shewanella marina]|uniref:DUF2141 domain-containing protein n=1 Tax=Shewanella marina TaxID=487319 RepID=UPI00046F191F|nr:DUF2141 domain-containing protein [Shewanella marina]
MAADIKKYVQITSFLLTTIITTSTHAAQIDFQINAISPQQGTIYIQLFKGEQNFTAGIAENSTMQKVTASSAQFTFPNLTAGEYAIRYFHDENNNGKLETNLMGMPTEGYGFSNNAKPNYGPVSYQAIKFTLAADQAIVQNQSHVIY